MNRNYFIEFFNEFDYPLEAREALLWAYDKIMASDRAKEFSAIVDSYANDMLVDYMGMINKAVEISKALDIHTYTGPFVLLIALSKPLKEFYKQKGLSLDIWKNSLFDLKYKLLKCKAIHGIWGTFVADWFGGFYRLARFGFGKLEFEIIEFGETFELDGIKLTPKSKVINVHIPKTGSPLNREDMLYAYNRAKEFYADIFNGGKAVFVCHSWLLFQKHKEILKPNSNLYQFIDDYKVVTQDYYPDYKETWRLFNTVDLSDYDKLPKDTSLQRKYIEMMKNGERTGWAYGAFAL